jgi:hypothetical protein
VSECVHYTDAPFENRIPRTKGGNIFQGSVRNISLSRDISKFYKSSSRLLLHMLLPTNDLAKINEYPIRQELKNKRFVGNRNMGRKGEKSPQPTLLPFLFFLLAYIDLPLSLFHFL